MTNAIVKTTNAFLQRRLTPCGDDDILLVVTRNPEFNLSVHDAVYYISVMYACYGATWARSHTVSFQRQEQCLPIFHHPEDFPLYMQLCHQRTLSSSTDFPYSNIYIDVNRYSQQYCYPNYSPKPILYAFSLDNDAIFYASHRLNHSNSVPTIQNCPQSTSTTVANFSQNLQSLPKKLYTPFLVVPAKPRQC